MKNYIVLFLSALLAGSVANAVAQKVESVREEGKTTTPDMSKIGDAKSWKLIASDAKAAQEDGKTVVHMKMKEGDGLAGDIGGVALVAGLEFAEGVIEVDLRGHDDQKNSFLGLAFHGTEDNAFEIVYFRPFNFKATDKLAHSHAVQYVSLPAHPWAKLRQDSPGVYENAVSPVPNPEGWFHTRIVVKKKSVSVFVDKGTDPCLVVDRLTDRQKGSVGLWAGLGKAAFANLKITPTRGATGGAAALPSNDGTTKNEAKAILDKAIKAHGGQETLEKLPCVRLEMKVILPGNDPNPKDWDWLFAAPDRLKEVRESYYMSRRRDSVWIAEARGAFKLQDGITLQPVPAKLVVAFQDDAYLMQVQRLVPLKEKQYELTKAVVTKVDGKPALGLRVRAQGHKDVTLFFDTETGLLVKVQRRAMDTSTLTEVAEERIYRNYQKQDGLQFASTISVTHDGLKNIQIEIKEAKFMQKVEDAEFRRK